MGAPCSCRRSLSAIRRARGDVPPLPTGEEGPGVRGRFRKIAQWPAARSKRLHSIAPSLPAPRPGWRERRIIAAVRPGVRNSARDRRREMTASPAATGSGYAGIAYWAARGEMAPADIGPDSHAGNGPSFHTTRETNRAKSNNRRAGNAHSDIRRPGTGPTQIPARRTIGSATPSNTFAPSHTPPDFFRSERSSARLKRRYEQAAVQLRLSPSAQAAFPAQPSVIPSFSYTGKARSFTPLQSSTAALIIHKQHARRHCSTILPPCCLVANRPRERKTLAASDE